jgi:hypothetical protein
MHGPNTTRKDSTALEKFYNSAFISAGLSIIAYFFSFLFNVQSIKIINFGETQGFELFQFFE